MGQNQVTSIESTEQLPKNNELKVPTFVEAQISLDGESVIRPNGYFPPEIIVLILKYADMQTCMRSSQSCKLWYESIQEVFKNKYMSQYSVSELDDNWKSNFYRRTLADQNLAKGSWWAEALSSVHYPQYDWFSYVASFEGNKVIFNNHHIHMTSYSNSKFYEIAYQVDLDTMERKVIDYGTMFANGFKVTTLISNDYEYFDWKEFDIHDGTATRTIKREFEPPVDDRYYWRRTQYQLFVNLDGSPTVASVNCVRNNYPEEVYTRYVEVVDLRTGEKIAKPQIEVFSVIAFLGDTIIATFADGLFFTNIYTGERMLLSPTAEAKNDVYYCKESHTLGYANNEGVITFYDWPSFKQVSQIDVKACLPPPEEANFQIISIAFDKSKLVVAVLDLVPFYAVFDIRTGAVIKTFFNNADGPADPTNCQIYLAPNGKIVTDCRNLTVYDFISPRMCQQIPAIYAEYKPSKVSKFYVDATSLATIAAQKLNASLQSMNYHTFFGTTKHGVQYRITGIGSHGNDPSNWEEWQSVDWKQLTNYLAPWKSDSEVRNTFQVTSSDYSYPIGPLNNHEISWSRLKRVLLIFERLNEETKQWEFAEPIDTSELAEKNTEGDETVE